MNGYQYLEVNLDKDGDVYYVEITEPLSDKIIFVTGVYKPPGQEKELNVTGILRKLNNNFLTEAQGFGIITPSGEIPLGELAILYIHDGYLEIRSVPNV